MFTEQKRTWMFWVTSPFLLAGMAVPPVLYVIDPDLQITSTRLVGWGIIEVLCTLLLLGLYNPPKFWWAWRCVAALIFASSVICFLGALIESGGRLTTDEHNDTTVFHALLGLLLIGMLLPALAYAIYGRFTFRRPIDNERLDWDEMGENCDSAFHTSEQAQHRNALRPLARSGLTISGVIPQEIKWKLKTNNSGVSFLRKPDVVIVKLNIQQRIITRKVLTMIKMLQL
jgi:hypothetical protein